MNHMQKSMNELQREFNEEAPARAMKSSRPLFKTEYYQNQISSKKATLQILFANWATTPNFEYEVWYCHRMILLAERALDKLARMK